MKDVPLREGLVPTSDLQKGLQPTAPIRAPAGGIIGGIQPTLPGETGLAAPGSQTAPQPAQGKPK